MNDGLILRSAIDLMDSSTQIAWSNKHMLPAGYTWNEDGYVITLQPFPFIRVCMGLRFSYLIRIIGMSEFIRSNLIVLRLLNEGVHKAIVSVALWYSLKKTGIIYDRSEYDKIVDEVYKLTKVPMLNSSFISWRRTWFSETCVYDTVSKVLRAENSGKIDSDRELMKIDEKYITTAVAEFTGFSRRRIDLYWNEKQWTRKLRTLYTLEETYTELERQGIIDPSRKQIAELSGLSVRTISSAVKDIEKLVTTMSAKSLNANEL